MFFVKFWGVRGSIACCSPSHIRYGGNTSCVEVGVGEHRFILDAGTGIRALSKVFREDDVRTIYLLLSHTHWDHINGFPFFRPAYDKNRRMHIYAGHLKRQGLSIQGVLCQQMREPVFPVPLDAMKAIVECEDFDAGEAFSLFPGVRVRTQPLNHPNGATGYRIEYGGKAVCYVTDTEHIPGRTDENIVKLIEGADLVIYDSTYTEDEFPGHVGWGHSTWNEGLRLCRLAGARQLAIFHHDPDHDDTAMDRIAAQARAAAANTIVTRECMTIVLDGAGNNVSAAHLSSSCETRAETEQHRTNLRKAACSREEVAERLRGLAQPLRMRWGIRIVGFFGSCARGEMEPESDIDLLVDFDRPLGLELTDAIGEIEAALGRPIDIASRKWLRPRLRAAIAEELVYVDA